jgi:uncharacterized protein YutE (UPF0331/DUF86 family)
VIDPELVRRKIALILDDLRRLAPLAATSLEDFLASPTDDLVAERLLERLIGRMIDINYHVVTESGHAPPRDYYLSFIEIGHLGVLPTDFARRLAASAGLRNRLVHEYDAIDRARVHEALSTAPDDVRAYLRYVETYLERLDSDN